VKTSNVMREEGGRIVLMDFGAASMSDPLAAGGGIYGTPQTAAPELFCGAEGTPATDVYSVGVLLFRLVTGHFPVEASTHEDLIAKHARGERTSLRTLRPSAPPWFASIVDRALDPDPNARFESAARMEESLANGLHRKARISTRALVLLGLLLLGVTAFDTPRIPIPTRLAVDASLMRDRIHDVSPLKSGDRIETGEGVFLVLRCEEPVWTYVINRDQAGSVYVLHPLPGFDKPNPLMPGVEHRLPGHHEGVTESWWVSSAGGDEEFIVIVSRGHRPELEAAVQALPHAGPRGGELDVP
jgi:serine/threonine protein kinase